MRSRTKERKEKKTSLNKKQRRKNGDGKKIRKHEIEKKEGETWR